MVSQQQSWWKRKDVLPGNNCDILVDSAGDNYGYEVLHHVAQHTTQFLDNKRSELESGEPNCVVSIIGCTGDWTDGWDCSDRGQLDRFITSDLSAGRMVDIITRGEPALMVCHWTGIYFNGEEVGFEIFREVVRRLHQRFDNLIWMKNSEIARYWAAKELTRIEHVGNQIKLTAPFACPTFNTRIPLSPDR